MCADKDIEQAADLAAEYVRITRRPLDGNAQAPLEWDQVADAVWDDAENDDLLQEVPD